MRDFLNSAFSNLWWPFLAVATAGAIGVGIGALLNRGRRT